MEEAMPGMAAIHHKHLVEPATLPRPTFDLRAGDRPVHDSVPPTFSLPMNLGVQLVFMFLVGCSLL